MSQQNKVTLVTPVTVPRYGICTGCGKKFQLGGSNLHGYTIPAHHARDIDAAKRGEYCPGSDKASKFIYAIKQKGKTA